MNSTMKKTRIFSNLSFAIAFTSTTLLIIMSLGLLVRIAFSRTEEQPSVWNAGVPPAASESLENSKTGDGITVKSIRKSTTAGVATQIVRTP
jgi:hypothetical protein